MRRHFRRAARRGKTGQRGAAPSFFVLFFFLVGARGSQHPLLYNAGPAAVLSAAEKEHEVENERANEGSENKLPW